MYQKDIVPPCLSLGLLPAFPEALGVYVAPSVSSSIALERHFTLTDHSNTGRSSQARNMTTPEQFILLAIGLFTILVRIFFRWRTVGPSNWQLDDYLMPLTGVSSQLHGPNQPTNSYLARTNYTFTQANHVIAFGSSFSLPR